MEGFEWVYEHVKRDLWLFSTSGGTDLCTAFVGGCPVLPVYSGEIQARCLGAAVEAWDEDGRPLTGEVGELVITEPMPSMPLYFWNDPDGERYRESYFETYPGVWRHGDWIKINERGGAVIYGRSDSTINRQGVRMGTSELYSAVEGAPGGDGQPGGGRAHARRGRLDDVAVRGAGGRRRARRGARGEDPQADARALLAAPRAGPHRRRGRRCRARCPGRSSRCRSRRS